MHIPGGSEIYDDTEVEDLSQRKIEEIIYKTGIEDLLQFFLRDCQAIISPTKLNAVFSTDEDPVGEFYARSFNEFKDVTFALLSRYNRAEEGQLYKPFELSLIVSRIRDELGK